MIELDKIEVKEASRVYGDFAEKTAFEVDMNAANILGSVAGGYAATRTYQKIEDKNKAKEQAGRTIENNHYDSVQNILRDLKIIFTPINIVYSVNGQVFEIIKVNEMTVPMKERFLMKDGQYFKGILINKMNMELQLAEQIFARRLLQTQLPGEFKTAHFSTRWLEKISEEVFETEKEKHLEKVASSLSIPLDVNLDSLRPFEGSSFFFEGQIQKVASVLDYFQSDIAESFTQKDMNKQVKVGFLPDRVVFLLNGQMIDQVSIMHMNEMGYEAFKKRDIPFFMEFFKDESERIGNSVVESVTNQQMPEFDDLSKEADEKDVPAEIEEIEDELDEDDEGEEKNAASLEEMLETDWSDFLPVDRDSFDLFYDTDIHPIVYDRILEEKIGHDWHESELEVVLKEIEVQFNLDKAINTIVLDKIGLLHAIQNENHAVFSSAFTFEKFVRSMNGKSTMLTDFEGDNEFEELLFALEIAKAVISDNVFLEFGNSVAPYVSEELFQDGIRFVSDQLFDEDNTPEHDFWNDVNNFLLRKWKERDAQGLEDDEEVKVRLRTENINGMIDRVLSSYAEFIEPTKPYDSIRDILQKDSFSIGELDTGVEETIVQNAGRHVIASLFLQMKTEEAVETIRISRGE